MTRLHRVIVSDRVSEEGLGTFVSHGSPITVQGSPMVYLDHGVIVSASGYVDSESEARRQAASAIEEIGRRLLAQAESMREVTQ